MKPGMIYELSDCIAMQRAFTEMVVDLIETGDDKHHHAWGIQLIGDHIADTTEQVADELCKEIWPNRGGVNGAA